MSVTKNDMVIEIAKRTGIEQLKVKQIVQLTLDGIIDTLVEQGHYELRNFGVFKVRKRKSRKARNPRTGDPVMVDSKNVVTFKAGKIMEARIEALSAPKTAANAPAAAGSSSPPAP